MASVFSSDLFRVLSLPLEEASFNLIRSKFLSLVCLASGCRVCEIAAIANVSYYQDFVVFHWFPGLVLMEKDGVRSSWPNSFTARHIITYKNIKNKWGVDLLFTYLYI